MTGATILGKLSAHLRLGPLVFRSRFCPTQFALNRNLWGKYPKGKLFGSLAVYDTIGGEFTKTFEDVTFKFKAYCNWAANVGENTIVAFVETDEHKRCLVTYKKGDSRITLR